MFLNAISLGAPRFHTVCFHIVAFLHLVFLHPSIRHHVFKHLELLQQTFFMYLFLSFCLSFDLSFFLSFILSFFLFSFFLSFLVCLFVYLFLSSLSLFLSFHYIWCENTTYGNTRCGIRPNREVRKHIVQKSHSAKTHREETWLNHFVSPLQRYSLIFGWFAKHAFKWIFLIILSLIIILTVGITELGNGFRWSQISNRFWIWWMGDNASLSCLPKFCFIFYLFQVEWETNIIKYLRNWFWEFFTD